VFASLIDDLKAKVDSMVKLAVAGAIAAAAVTAACLCFAIALFLWVQQHYSTLEAWVALGGLFVAVAAIGGIVMLAVRSRKTPPKPQPRPQETSAISRLLQDPTMLITGVQIARMIGGRRLLPLLILGVVAGGLLLGRNGHSDRFHHDRADHDTDIGADIG
jgi:O-antigen/teichoic acid export membrane protein